MQDPTKATKERNERKFDANPNWMSPLPPTHLPTLKANLDHLCETLKLISSHYFFPDPLKVIHKKRAHNHSWQLGIHTKELLFVFTIFMYL